MNSTVCKLSKSGWNFCMSNIFKCTLLTKHFYILKIFKTFLKFRWNMFLTSSAETKIPLHPNCIYNKNNAKYRNTLGCLDQYVHAEGWDCETLRIMKQSRYIRMCRGWRLWSSPGTQASLVVMWWLCTKVFYASGPNLVIQAWMGDE